MYSHQVIHYTFISLTCLVNPNVHLLQLYCKLVCWLLTIEVFKQSLNMHRYHNIKWYQSMAVSDSWMEFHSLQGHLLQHLHVHSNYCGEDWECHCSFFLLLVEGTTEGKIDGSSSHVISLFLLSSAILIQSDSKSFPNTFANSNSTSKLTRTSLCCSCICQQKSCDFSHWKVFLHSGAVSVFTYLARL